MITSLAGLKRGLTPLRLRLFPHCWLNLIKKELSGCNTVLDLGCGSNSPLQYFNVHFSVGVELYDPYLLETRRKGIHNQYIKADIRKVEFKPRSFDAAIAIELLEHLTKEEGHALIKKMERWARKRVIITTPNGYLWQNGYDDNPLQEHKSGWSVKELQELGFEVYGMNGWKKLMGYKGSIKYKPALSWQGISELTQEIIYFHPRLAFQLFATKQVGNGK